MTPEQAYAAAQLIVRQLDAEWKNTYKVLCAFPEEKRDYRPEPRARTAFELARHLAGPDIWFINGVVRGTFEEPDRIVPEVSTFAELAAWYKDAVPKVLDEVRRVGGETLAKELRFYGIPFPAVQHLLFALVHMVHHRGQLTTYIRPCGGKVRRSTVAAAMNRGRDRRT